MSGPSPLGSRLTGMNIAAIVSREILVFSRNPKIYALRLALVGSIAVVWFLSSEISSLSGPMSLRLLTYTALTFFGLTAVLLSADTVSSERRNRTLGLLLLTPLKPAELLLGKLFSNSSHFLFCLIAVAPIFALTLLRGGLEWTDVVLELVNVVSMVVLALTVGLFYSTIGHQKVFSVLLSLLTLGGCILGPRLGFWLCSHSFPYLTAFLESFENQLLAAKLLTVVELLKWPYLWIVGSNFGIGTVLFLQAWKIFRINWRSETDSNRSQSGSQNSIYRRFFASKHCSLKFQDRFNPYYYLFWNRWTNRLQRLTIVLIGTTIYLGSVAAVPLVASFSNVELSDSLFLCYFGLFLLEAIFRIYVYLDVLAQGRYLRVSGWFELIATVPNFDKEFTEGIETSLQRSRTSMFYALFGAHSFQWLLMINFNTLGLLFIMHSLHCSLTYYEFKSLGTHGVYLGIRSINRISIYSRKMLRFFLLPACCFVVFFLEDFLERILNFRAYDSNLWSIFASSVGLRVFFGLWLGYESWQKDCHDK